MLPSSWRHDFALALLFTIVQPWDKHGLPAYQCLAESHVLMDLDEQQGFLRFLASLVELIRSSLTWASLTSLESWLTQLPKELENQVARAQMEDILATRKQQLVEENLGFFAELPMESECLEVTLEFFAELPMADEWTKRFLGCLQSSQCRWMDGRIIPSAMSFLVYVLECNYAQNKHVVHLVIELTKTLTISG